MTIRRPRPAPLSNPPPAGDVSAPLNMAIGPDGSVVLPPNVNVLNRPIVTGDIFGGLYVGAFNFSPAFVRGPGDNGVAQAWWQSGWTCTVAGTVQWRHVLQSPAGIVLDYTGPFNTYGVGAIEVISFVAANTLISNMPSGIWSYVIQKVGGGGTFVPGVLGVGFGNMVVTAIG